MDFKKIVTFEPINLTKILLYLIVIAVIMIFFKPQISTFFDSLSQREVTVGADGTLSFGALAEPSIMLTNFSERAEVDMTDKADETRLKEGDLRDLNTFAKSSIAALIDNIQTIEEGEIGVIDFAVNEAIYYYKDQSMQAYLSIAAERIRYLAFYERGRFVGYIKIERVIKGLASKEESFVGFGEKLVNGQWAQFRGLITADKAFEETPTIQELYDALQTSGESEIPFLQGQKLSGILTYEDVAKGMYKENSKQEESNSRTTWTG